MKIVDLENPKEKKKKKEKKERKKRSQWLKLVEMEKQIAVPVEVDGGTLQRVLNLNLGKRLLT